MELRKRGIRLKLQTRPLKVLLLLVRHPGEVVSRERIRQELWGDGTFVDFDRNLNLCISQIRGALSDDSAEPRYIETVPRVGYRFIGELNREPDRAPEPAAPVAHAGMRNATAVAAAVAVLTLIGVALWAVRREAGGQPPPIRIAPFTGYGGLVHSPAFSPTGDRVAFAWKPPGSGTHIYVKQLAGGESVAVTQGAGHDESPLWSNDGSQVAFVREEDGVRALYVVPALGGTARKLYTFNQRKIFHWLGRPMVWASDGTLLVSDRVLSSASPTGPINPLRIFRVADGNRADALTDPPADWWGDVAPVVSPDGRWLALLRGRGFSMTAIHVKDLRNPGVREREILSGARALSGLAFTPDSASLYFGGDLNEGTGIWRVAVAGGSPAQVVATSRLPLCVSITMDGRRAAYTDSTESHTLWALDLRSNHALPRPLLAAGGAAGKPVLSPKGDRVVFAADRSGHSAIWVANADGSGVQQLTQPSLNAFVPQWSPDARQLAFGAQVDNDPEIFVMAVDSGSPVRLTRNAGLDATPSWSADGQWIYFSSKRSGMMEIWKTRADGSSPQPVRLTRQGGHQPKEWRGHIYYRPDMILHGLKRVAVTGGDESWVTKQEIRDFAVDASGIYVLSGNTISQLDPERGTTTPVARLEGRDVTGFSITPDKSTVLFSQLDQVSSEVMVVSDLR